MNEAINKYKTWIVVVVLLVIGFFLYKFLFPSFSQQGPSGLVQSSGVVSGSSLDADFVNQLIAIQNIQLKTDILSEPAFARLVDFSRPLGSQPKGRDNPFAPLPISITSSNSDGSLNGTFSAGGSKATTTKTSGQ